MDKRPKLSIPRSKLEMIHDGLSIAVLLVMFIYVIKVWGQLPEQMPIHFNARGEPDGWGGRGSLFFLPGLSVLLAAGLSLLSQFPHTFNYPNPVTPENAPRQYANARRMLSWMKLELVVLFGYIEWRIIQAGLTGQDRLGIWLLPVVLLVLLGTAGYYAVRAFRLK
ncbi:DUF1648 domain-containing protein [Paenibacillus sp. y28]|uniref:DUF1648 domain-containing protein n=1 Tax=Paenibacillus sp. y28 TaxID=3129110 RepID=UPI0030167F8E